MHIETGTTPTGQDYISFQTQYDEKCTIVALQGEKYLRCACRQSEDISMHAPYTLFTQEQVRELLPYLQAFAEDGTLGLKR